MTVDQTHDKRRAIRIIGALRDGSNCLEGVSRFSAGRGPLFGAASEQLEELEFTAGTSVRWLKGRYGDGKTHTFARLLELGLSRNWLTSYVQISAPGQGTELSKLHEVYAAIVRNCICKEMIEEEDGQIVPGRRPGWRWLLARWTLALKAQAGAARGDVPTFRLLETIDRTIAAIQDKHGLSGSFLHGLREYARAHFENDREWEAVLLDWFEGVDVHSRGSPLRQRLRAAGVMESLSKRNAKEMLRGLSLFTKYRGFGGMLIVLDEVENVLLATPKARREAYITLRELIDNVDYRHGISTTCLYAAGTPDLFESEKGFPEYEALATRVLLPGGDGPANPRATIVDLSRFPLRREDFSQMASRITTLFEVGKGLQPTSALADTLDQMLDNELRKNPEMTARTWVRVVVDHLSRQ